MKNEYGDMSDVALPQGMLSQPIPEDVASHDCGHKGQPSKPSVMGDPRNVHSGSSVGAGVPLTGTPAMK